MLACLIGCLFASVALGAGARGVRLANGHIRAEFKLSNGVWANWAICRADGSDAVTFDSDEFEILLFDDTCVTARDYLAGDPRHVTGKDGTQVLLINYQPRSATSSKAPGDVTVGYTLGKGPYIRKVVMLDPINDKLKKYGAKLDAIVPDHGWQNTKAFEYIFQPQVNATHSPLPDLAKALKKHDDTRLGIWMALDGTNNSTAHGLKIGYKPAYTEDFRRRYKWMAGKTYFDILDPKYQRDLKKALKFLIADAGVDYIKHDFNHNFTSRSLTQRHAREACLDVTLGLLEYERSLNPGVYQNYTNGSWFSPWWLQHVDSLWMMSGDSDNSRKYPHLAHRDRSTSYRDEYFYENFNNPKRCARPVIPIANFMTHGIIFSEKRPFTDGKDLLDDWANHVMMYFARGTMVKELYLTPKLLNEAQWEILGRAANWAQRNQHRLKNTVIIGGNPGKGEVYGFVSWVDDRAILTVRNPSRDRRTLTVPFDRTAYYRGPKDKPYCARAIYPFVEHAPGKLISGESFKVTVPADTVMVYEIDPGRPPSDSVAGAKPLPAAKASVAKQHIVKLEVPDEAMKRYELVVQAQAMVDVRVEVNEEPFEARQSAKDKRWSIAAFDLAKYRGKTIVVEIGLDAKGGAVKGAPIRAALTNAWVIADRPVKVRPAEKNQHLPYPIGRGFRRVSQIVVSNLEIPVMAGIPWHQLITRGDQR